VRERHRERLKPLATLCALYGPLCAFRSPNPLAPPFQKFHPAWVQESNYPQDWQSGQGVRPRWLQLVWPRIPELLTRSCLSGEVHQVVGEAVWCGRIASRISSRLHSGHDGLFLYALHLLEGLPSGVATCNANRRRRLTDDAATHIRQCILLNNYTRC
jgi:hypothetical protein